MAADEEGSCPVCGAAEETRGDCAVCDWPLTTDWLPGTGDPGEFRRRFEAATRRFDAVPAARAFGDRSTTFIRGGVPDDAEWSAAERTALPQAPTPEETVRGRLTGALRELETCSPTLVEVDAGGVTASVVTLDRLGTPSVVRSAAASWATLLPELSRDPAELRFQLAGGRTVRDWTPLRRAPADLGLRPAGPVMLACALPGWPVPERATTILKEDLSCSEPLRPAGISVTALLAELVADLPLIRAYHLIGAVVDPPTGKVRRELVEIFAPGTRPGHRADLAVRRPPGARDGTVLAAVVGDPGHWAPVEMRKAALVPGINQVSAVLDAPGRVRFVAPGLLPESRSLPELLALVPDELPAAADVDLVCGVELCGTPDVVARRRAFVAELLRVLADERDDGLRVAVLGYLDHRFFDRTREKAGVVYGTELGPVARAAARLHELPSPQPYYPERAPVEDMLSLAGRYFRRDRRIGGRALLTVGDRLPHPVKIGQDPIMRCPRGHDWRSLLKRLRTDLDVDCFAVTDQPPRRSSGVVWQRLGSAGLYELATADPRQVAVDMGVLPREDDSLPFPLITPKGAS
ncbi:MAG: hypothetical protein ACRDP6_08065 [Actinoallomurus sp.]